MRFLLHPSPKTALSCRLLLVIGLGLLGVLCLAWSPIALIILCIPFGTDRRRLGRLIIRKGFTFYISALRHLGILELKIQGQDSLETSTSTLVAPNHPGLLDAVILLSLIPDCACILKSSLLNNPLFGPGARLAGYIPNDLPHEMIRRSVKELREGHPVLMFPEGTRSEDSPISPLKLSPFLIANRAGVSVTTILIESPSGFLGKGWPLLRVPQFPVSVDIRIGASFPPERDTRGWARSVENHFRSNLPH